MDANNQSPLLSGTVLEHYKIIKSIGQGGFGITYLANDQSINRPVVIKEYFPSELSIRTQSQSELSLLNAERRNDYKAGLARFKREAETLSEFNHPNIVKVQTYFEANNTAYFVMEYVEGQALEKYQESLGRPLKENEIISQLLPILKGLAVVHDKGLLHLDIKPDNILKTAYGEPLLIDFGGARVDTAKASKVISNHSSMVGTTGYSPPEQYTQVAEQTAATDLYAFGMTLYAMMAPSAARVDSTDRQAFVYLQDKADPLKPIRTIASGYSEALYQAVEQCTMLKQKDRPQSVEALQTLLQDIHLTAQTADAELEPESEPPQAQAPNEAKQSAQDHIHTPAPAASTSSTTNKDSQAQRTNSEPAAGEPVERANKPKSKAIAMLVTGLICLTLIINWQQEKKQEQARQAIKQQQIAQQEKAAAEKAAAEKVAAEKVAAEKVAAEKVAAEKVAAEKVAAEKVAAEKAAAEKAAAEKAAAEKAAAEKAAAEKAASEKAEKYQAHYSGRYFYRKENYQEAFPWFLKAAELGHAPAQWYLGMMYRDGQGVQQDYGKALAWYRKSAAQGLSYAQWHLGDMYRYGIGVPQDKNKAIYWYRRGKGHGSAARALEELLNEDNAAVE